MGLCLLVGGVWAHDARQPCVTEDCFTEGLPHVYSDADRYTGEQILELANN